MYFTRNGGTIVELRDCLCSYFNWGKKDFFFWGDRMVSSKNKLTLKMLYKPTVYFYTCFIQANEWRLLFQM
jgi:hypothetical protein